MSGWIRRLLWFSAATLLFLTSFLWHLPAAWVWTQLSSKLALPPSLQVSALQGVWWHGQAQGDWQAGSEALNLGTWQWQWRPSALVSGDIALDLRWTPVAQSVTAEVRLNADRLQLAQLTGRLPLADFSGVVPQVGALLSSAKGDVALDGLTAEMPLNAQAWPNRLDGVIEVRHLDWMGAQVPHLQIQPRLAQKSVNLTLTGGGERWRLQGVTEVNPNRTYRSQLTIQADSAESMPGWVSLILPMKTPVLAESDQKGRW